jgi:uncharacterized protein YfaT (DUF1175 family)
MYTETRLRLVRAVPIAGAAIVGILSLVASLALAAAPSPHLNSPSDRKAFRRWFTFLAESRYYARKPLRGVSDADGLLRWAYHQALSRHDARWYHTVELPLLPAMPSVREFEASLCDLHPYPFVPLLVSRNLADAEPGDLLMYRRFDLAAHLMIYIGSSQVVPSPKKWVIYLTNSPKDIHKVSLDSLRDDPSSGWRPAPENPDFLGVWRLDILGEPE